MTLINDYRAQNGLGVLSIDSTIRSAAEWMSIVLPGSGYRQNALLAAFTKQ